MIYDVIIIGLGAAGISASIYAKRSGLNVAVINFNTPGGIINESSIVENYPGFKSISGPDLAVNFFEHFNSLDVPLFNEEVIDIIDGEYKKIVTKTNEYLSKKVIIASGRKPKKLGIKDEDKFFGRGISYCALCDGNLYKEKTVAVIGGGNSALESASYLSKIASKVYLLVRRDKLIGDSHLIEEVEQCNNVEIIYNTIVEELIINNELLTGVKTNNDEYKVDGVFVNIGYEPSTSILKSLELEMDRNYIVVDKTMETSIKGIYACGDIIKKDLYQLVTAVSEGAIAANNVFKSIKKK